MADHKDTRVYKNEHVWITGEVVTVEVGGAKELFYVHKENLIRNAPCMVGLTGRSRAKGLSNYLLPNVNPHTFKLYAQYIYSGKIPCIETGKQTMPTRLAEMGTLLDFYLLAQFLNDIGAMNAATSCLLATYSDPTDLGSWVIPDENLIKKIYAKTNKESPMRKLVVDIYEWDAGANTLGRFEEDRFPAEFLFSLSAASLGKLADARGRDKKHGIYKASCCNYHQHKKNEPCANKKRKRDDLDLSPEDGSKGDSEEELADPNEGVEDRETE